MIKVLMKTGALVTAGLILFMLLYISACTPILTPPREWSSEKRYEMFPGATAPINRSVMIHWNEYAVPYIVAESDEDAAFALGAVHIHLRWAQVEILKRLSAGRLSEMVGPFTRDIDHALRILHLGRAAPAILANMPDETRHWLNGYVKGMNWYINNAGIEPHEFAILNMQREEWTAEDVIGISRLAGIDLSWIFYVSFLQMPDNDARKEIWQRFLNLKESSPPSFTYESPNELAHLLAHNSRSGSNSIAIGSERSKTGAALLANDPHLGISIPNFWLLAGVKSPGMHAVGMMIPGLPFFALGRNEHIAWGGTNMRALSTHLFELPEADISTLQRRAEKIAVRWWLDREVVVRESEYGPIISDAPFVASNSQTIALQWAGHQGSSDEISAFLRVNKASNFTEFRNAFKTYAVSAQNMLYADRSGNVGMVLAYRLPLTRDSATHTALIKPAAVASQQYRTSLDLPYAYNPKQGYIASANNKPVELDVPIALSYALPDRLLRMEELVDGSEKIGLRDLKALQTDTFSRSSFEIVRILARRVPAIKELSSETAAFYNEFIAWDGHYSMASRGAVAFEVLMTHLVPTLLAEEERFKSILLRGGSWKTLLLPVLDQLPLTELELLLRTALQESFSEYRQFSNWGEMHRLTLQHPLARMPLIGGRYKMAEFGVPGGNDTLLKSGHRLTDEKHQVTYGSQSRHISDLSDPDANYFVLFGGQDGWLFSPQTVDQIPLWRTGEYIQLPLNMAAVHKQFDQVVTVIRQKKL